MTNGAVVGLTKISCRVLNSPTRALLPSRHAARGGCALGACGCRINPAKRLNAQSWLLSVVYGTLGPGRPRFILARKGAGTPGSRCRNPMCGQPPLPADAPNPPIPAKPYIRTARPYLRISRAFYRTQRHASPDRIGTFRVHWLRFAHFGVQPIMVDRILTGSGKAAWHPAQFQRTLDGQLTTELVLIEVMGTRLTARC